MFLLTLFNLIHSAKNSNGEKLKPSEITYYTHFDLFLSPEDKLVKNECQFKRSMIDLVYIEINDNQEPDPDNKLGNVYYISSDRMLRRHRICPEFLICKNCFKAMPQIQKIMKIARENSMIIQKPLGKMKIPDKKLSEAEERSYTLLNNYEKEGLFAKIPKKKWIQKIRAYDFEKEYFLAFADYSIVFVEKNLDHKIDIKDIDSTFIFEVSDFFENDKIKKVIDSIKEKNDIHERFQLFEKDSPKIFPLRVTTISEELGIVCFIRNEVVNIKKCQAYVEKHYSKKQAPEKIVSEKNEPEALDEENKALDEENKALDEENKASKENEALDEENKASKENEESDQNASPEEKIDDEIYDSILDNSWNKLFKELEKVRIGNERPTLENLSEEELKGEKKIEGPLIERSENLEPIIEEVDESENIENPESGKPFVEEIFDDSETNRSIPQSKKFEEVKNKPVENQKSTPADFTPPVTNSPSGKKGEEAPSKAIPLGDIPTQNKPASSEPKKSKGDLEIPETTKKPTPLDNKPLTEKPTEKNESPSCTGKAIPMGYTPLPKKPSEKIPETKAKKNVTFEDDLNNKNKDEIKSKDEIKNKDDTKSKDEIKNKATSFTTGKADQKGNADSKAEKDKLLKGEASMKDDKLTKGQNKSAGNITEGGQFPDDINSEDEILSESENIPEKLNLGEGEPIPKKENLGEGEPIPESANIEEGDDKTIPESSNIEEGDDKTIPESSNIEEGDDKTIPESSNIEEGEKIPKKDNLEGDDKTIPEGEKTSEIESENSEKTDPANTDAGSSKTEETSMTLKVGAMILGISAAIGVGVGLWMHLKKPTAFEERE